MLAANGAYNTQSVIYLAVMMPAGLIAAQIGIWLFKKLDNLQFRRLLIILMFASGLLLILRSLTGIIIYFSDSLNQLILAVICLAHIAL